MSEKQAKGAQELLDADELLHLAMTAINAGQHPQAMAMLKQAQKQDPENALIIYLLAAEHAQVGMFDRAMEGMERALAKAPDLQMARLQLGLLYTARDRLGDARPLFETLSGLPENDPLHWFGEGLLALLEERLDDCRTALQQGIQLNQGNPSLNGDMQRILAQLGKAGAAPAKPAEAAKPQAAQEKSAQEKAANSLFLSRYGNSGND